MPAQLQGYLARMQEELLQAHIFQSGSVMYEVLTTGQFDRPNQLRHILKLRGRFTPD